MKKITLKKLTLSNWRGYSNEIEFNEKETVISGRNKSRKSTIYNAFLWLLTGYDAENRSNFELFDTKVEYTHENAVPATVEGKFDIDGNSYIFKRSAEMGWVRPRGQQDHIRSGTDKYSYSIDNIERSAGEYKKFIEELFCDTEKLKIILNIKHIFDNMKDWKEARKHFNDIVGEIKQTDYKGDYGTLFEELNKYTIEQLKEQNTNLINPVKKRSKELPVEIETMTANLPDISDVDEAQDKIDEAIKRIKAIDDELQGSSESIKPLLEKRNAELSAVSKMRRELQDAKFVYDTEQEKGVEVIETNISAINQRNKSLKENYESNISTVSTAKRRKEALEKDIERYNSYRNELLERRDAIKARVFNADTCSYCGAELQGDKLEEAQNKFNNEKAKELANVVAEGKSNNEKKSQAEEDLLKLQSIISQQLEEPIYESVEELQSKLKEAKKSIQDFKDTEECKSALAKIKQAEENVTEIKQADNSELLAEKDTLIQSIKENSKITALSDEYSKQIARLDKVKAEFKENGIELAKLEQRGQMFIEYERERADITKHRVNKLFKRVNVTMLQMDKSGEWRDTCIIEFEGTKSGTYNAAEILLSGIDISNTFGEYFGINMPLFIDDVNLLSPNSMDAIDDNGRQVIRLLVSKNKTLIVE